MSTPYQYAAERRAEFVEQLKSWLRIPSISTQSEHAPDIRQAAEWVRSHALALGLTRAEIYETAGHPVVYGEWLDAGPQAPTVLLYGHYDVQPVDDPHKQWQSKPFEPEIRNGNLYARGATDDKGQVFLHLKAFEALMQTQGHFPLNFKIMIEGEEEIGSKHLRQFVQDHAALLTADVVVISDNHILSEDQPSIVYGLRGIIYTEVEVFGPDHDLHSGAYGGTVHNPAQALVEILAKLHDDQGRITIPHFYDQVRKLTPAERTALAKVPYTEATLKAETGVSQPWGEADYTVLERIGARPTLEICGIVGGWTGEGGKTVIPQRALAKVSCRLVPDQDPDHILELLKKYVAALTPPTIRSEVRLVHPGSPGVVLEYDSQAMQTAAQAYEHIFGKKPVFIREGGSIHVVSDFVNHLKTPVILMGFGLPDDNLHAPNEKFTLSMFYRGIDTAIHFYEHLPAALR